MPSIPTTDISVVEIVMHGISAADTPQAKPIDNVYHFRRTTTGSPLNKVLVQNAFQTAIGDVVLAALNVRYTQVDNKVRWVNDALDLPQSFAETGPGVITGDSCQDFVAAVIQLKSGLRGRNYRGSKHYAPISESSVKGDVLAAAGITLFTTLRNAILAGFTDADTNVWVPCVLSTTLSTLNVNPTTVVTADILSCPLNTTTGTMRRRKVTTVTV
jgi:hypothetical protein